MIEKYMERITIEFGILQLLLKHDMTCTKLTDEIVDKSKIQVTGAEIVAVLSKYADDGYVTKRTVLKNGTRHTYYRITDAGTKYLLDIMTTYRKYMHGINDLCQAINGPRGGIHSQAAIG